MSGAANVDQPDDMVTVESDAADRKVFHIEPKNADPAKRRRYTRTEVSERLDRIAESLDVPDRLMQQLTKNPISPALTSALEQNASMQKFATNFMENSAAMTALADMTRPYDKIAQAIGPKIPSGIDWASITPSVSVNLPGNLLGTGMAPSVVKGLGIFDGVKAVSSLGKISPRFAEILDDLEEHLPSKFASVHPASTPVAEWKPADLVMPDLAPNPVHETNERIGELVEILRAEREDHLRDQQRDAEALAEQKRKNAQDRALLRISEKRRRADAWKVWAGLGAGLVGAVAGVLALFL